MNSKKKIKLYKIFFCTSVFIVILAIGSFFNVNYIIKNQIYQNLVLKENSKAFDLWANPPASVNRKYYFFHVQNAKEVINGKKANLIQRGPYVYRVVLEKKNVVFKDKKAVSFNPVVTLYFEPGLSNGSEKDSITFLNVPAVVITFSVLKKLFLSHHLLNINSSN